MNLGTRRRKPLARESKKRVAERPLRREITAKLLDENPTCQIGLALRDIDNPQGDKCSIRSTEVHEWGQRSVVPGSHLREELCLAVCRLCHDWAHSGDPVAEELGFLVKSWNVADLVAAARAEEASVKSV